MTARSIDCDVLVIGSGLAGLLAALDLNSRGLRVVLACKGPLSESNSSYAQGGVAAVLNQIGSLGGDSEQDNVDNHLKDTLASGAGLSHSEVSRTIIEGGADLIHSLANLGVDFDRHSEGFASAREGGHSHARVLHSKDTTGRAITNALIAALKEQQAKVKGLIVLEYAFASELLLCEGAVCGAEIIERYRSGMITYIVKAGRTILATGGLGQVFERTTNPAIATGDGIALAFRAGAVIRDPEFVQFHPTALCLPGAPAFLISEAVRGEGAVLLDGRGERFMPRFHKDAELATRDVVARAIHSTIVEQELNYVQLDLRPIGSNLEARFPNIVAHCRDNGVDPCKTAIPICPAAHYFMGGILTDLNGRTNVSGLYAIGECASTGLHGANRLASNSLLEAGVMAARASSDIAQTFSDSHVGISSDQFIGQALPLPIPQDSLALRSAMYRLAGLVRSAGSLKKLQARIHKGQTLIAPRHPLDYEAANLLLAAELIATAALNRTESRGGHYREDFPESKEGFRRHQLVSNLGWSWQPHPEELTVVMAPPLAFELR